ncbi:MAG: dockerin type I repeat-containing protein, partial [candidate division Zixibacteria bacterium]|nr:dockerin type I repeat-containing protein [candidate division Zixibacteria bacterium]
IAFEFCPSITDPDDTEHTITYPEYPSWCTVQNDSVIGIAPEEASVQTLTVAVADYCSADTMSFDISTFLCGDTDQSGEVDIDDAVFLINYVFAGGPAPEPMEAGDADCSGDVDIDDIVYLIAYIFSGGPEACEGC